MVFHWCMTDSKPPQVFRSLLSIPADLNNAVVWTVSTHPIISKSSSPCTNPLVTITKGAPITIGITVTFMFHIFSQFPSNVEVLILLFNLFHFYSVVSRDSKVHNSASSYLFCWFFTRSGHLSEMRGSVRMLKSHWSLCLIFQDRCCVVHIPFVRMVKFNFLAQFPVDHLAYPVVSSLILIPCYFAAFANVIDRFVSITTWPTFAILLRLIFFRFDMVSPYGVVLCYY